jgi:hypothetical protein
VWEVWRLEFISYGAVASKQRKAGGRFALGEFVFEHGFLLLTEIAMWKNWERRYREFARVKDLGILAVMRARGL